VTAVTSSERSAREVSDRLAIYELYARYAQAADLEDGEAYSACLDEEGKVRGRDRLAKIAGKAPGMPIFRHLTVNALVTSYAGQRATGTAYFVVLSPQGGIHQYGRYDDVIVRDTDGQWRFSERMDLAAYNAGSSLP
jgi:hypothetical protein